MTKKPNPMLNALIEDLVNQVDLEGSDALELARSTVEDDTPCLMIDCPGINTPEYKAALELAKDQHTVNKLITKTMATDCDHNLSKHDSERVVAKSSYRQQIHFDQLGSLAKIAYEGLSDADKCLIEKRVLGKLEEQKVDCDIYSDDDFIELTSNTDYVCAYIETDAFNEAAAEKFGSDVYYKTFVKHIPIEEQAAWAFGGKSDICEALASMKSGLSKEAIKELATSDEPIVRAFLAGNPQTPVEILDELAEDEDWEVCEAVGSNPNTNSETLSERLCSHNSWGVRLSVAKNPSSPISVLEKLSGDGDEDVSEAANQTLAERKSKLNANATSEVDFDSEFEESFSTEVVTEAEGLKRKDVEAMVRESYKTTIAKAARQYKVSEGCVSYWRKKLKTAA